MCVSTDIQCQGFPGLPGGEGGITMAGALPGYRYEIIMYQFLFTELQSFSAHHNVLQIRMPY